MNLVAKTRKEIQRKNEFLSKQMIHLKRTDARLKALKHALGALEKRLEDYRKRIPRSAEISRFFRDIDTIAKKKGIGLISVQPQPEKKEKSLTRIPIRMVFKGNFANIHRLLNALESLKRLVVMEQMTIVRTSTDKQCQVELLASIFKRESMKNQ
ncbi:MAG: type 4a pilus biogenesis protein PilO [Deltaproteobacteria bacterium]|nr:type 4a pilus biogenesis protein PilO [Deltaproteobacteria bacterium]